MTLFEIISLVLMGISTVCSVVSLIIAILDLKRKKSNRPRQK